MAEVIGGGQGAEVIRGGQGYSTAFPQKGDIVIRYVSGGGGSSSAPSKPAPPNVSIKGGQVFINGQGHSVAPSLQEKFIQQRTGGYGSSSQKAILQARTTAKEIQRQQVIQQQLQQRLSQENLIKQAIIRKQTRTDLSKQIQIPDIQTKPYIEKRVVGSFKDPKTFRDIKEVEFVKVDPTGTGYQKEKPASKEEIEQFKQGQPYVLSSEKISDVGLKKKEITSTILGGYEDIKIKLRHSVTKPIVGGYEDINLKLRHSITEPIFTGIETSTGKTIPELVSLGVDFKRVIGFGGFGIKGKPSKLKEFEKGFYTGIITDVREKPAKQLLLYGGGKVVGMATQTAGAGLKALGFGSKVGGKLGKGFGYGVGGLYAVSTGSKIVTAPSFYEAGSITGVALKDVSLFGLGEKSGSDYIKYGGRGSSQIQYQKLLKEKPEYFVGLSKKGDKTEFLIGAKRTGKDVSMITKSYFKSERIGGKDFQITGGRYDTEFTTKNLFGQKTIIKDKGTFFGTGKVGDTSKYIKGTKNIQFINPIKETSAYGDVSALSYKEGSTLKRFDVGGIIKQEGDFSKILSGSVSKRFVKKDYVKLDLKTGKVENIYKPTISKVEFNIDTIGVIKQITIKDSGTTIISSGRSQKSLTKDLITFEKGSVITGLATQGKLSKLAVDSLPVSNIKTLTTNLGLSKLPELTTKTKTLTKQSKVFQPTKLKIDTTLTKQKQDLGIVQSTKLKSKTLTKQSMGSIFSIGKTKTKQLTKQKQDLNVFQINKLKSKTLTKQKKIPKLKTIRIPRENIIISPRIDKPTTPRYPPPKPKLYKYSRKPTKKYSVSIRRFKKWKPIGVFGSIGKAFGAGRSRVSKTLGASFKIGGVGKLPSLSKGLYKSKKEKGVYIEKRKYRLSRKGEKKEIQIYGKKKKR